MTTAPNEPKLDPFTHDIVRDPRAIGATIESVNAPALHRLVDVFQQAETGVSSHPPAVQLILSEPGFGKSHLIGRLFRKLENDATLVYLRPFQDPDACWVQLLSKVVHELDRPDKADKIMLGPEDQSQLTVLTRNILAKLAGLLIVNGELPPPSMPPGASRAIQTGIWNRWMGKHFEPMLQGLERHLGAQGVQVTPNRKAWLKVLRAYAFSPDGSEVRDICLDWLLAQPMSIEDGRQNRPERWRPPSRGGVGGRSQRSLL